MLLGREAGRRQAQRWVHAETPPSVAKRSSEPPRFSEPPIPVWPWGCERAACPPAPTSLGRILPREERCWESWGGGDAQVRGGGREECSGC